MRRLFAFCLLVLLLGPTIIQAQEAQDVPGIELNNFRWNKTTLHALTVTQENQTWWNPYFVDLSKRAVEQWNQAIDFFAEKYPDYTYVSSVNIVLTVSNTTLPDYDIYIAFAEILAINSLETLGLTTTVPSRNGTIQKAIIELSSKNGPIDLTRSEQRDVATHELGHALGLGHSNSSKDLMFPYYDLFSSGNAISTLDLYGLATTFSWITASSVSKSVPNFVTLPPDIIYEYAPVTSPAPKGIEDNPLVKAIVIFLTVPYMAVIVGVLILFLVVTILFYWRSGRNRRRQK
jgi:predicted Zn-dependent protease